jgi:CheY-like chemotaxis protein
MVVKKYCIFIDDDPYSQAVFTKALSDVSPETICFTAANGIDALYMMTKEDVIPSYIFIELNMPKMNGLEFLKTIKAIQGLKDIPVIVHSTAPQPHKVIELKESGALAIYLRPYEYMGVCNMLHLCFGEHMAAIQQN